MYCIISHATIHFIKIVGDQMSLDLRTSQTSVSGRGQQICTE